MPSASPAAADGGYRGSAAAKVAAKTSPAFHAGRAGARAIDSPIRKSRRTSLTEPLGAVLAVAPLVGGLVVVLRHPAFEDGVVALGGTGGVPLAGYREDRRHALFDEPVLIGADEGALLGHRILRDRDAQRGGRLVDVAREATMDRIGTVGWCA